MIANGEGTTGGFGLGKNHALYLRKLGVDVVTVGEKGFFKKDLLDLMGKSSFLLRPANFSNNPFQTIDRLFEKLKDIDTFLIEFHAATTAEKQAMAFFVDGKAAAVVGTHSKALTSDAEILPKGTGRLTDNGRCGSLQSVGGFLPSVEIEKFLTGVPARSRETVAGTEIQGVLFEVEGNRCLSAEILRRPVTVADTAKEEEEC